MILGAANSLNMNCYDEYGGGFTLHAPQVSTSLVNS